MLRHSRSDAAMGRVDNKVFVLVWVLGQALSASPLAQSSISNFAI
jgi:hypothetical protein